MKMLKRLILGFLTTVNLFTSSAKSSQMDPFPIELIIEPVPAPTTAGTINLEVKIVFREICQNSKLTVSGIDNLEYTGDTVWYLSSNPKDTTVLNLQMVIPENDTSGIGLNCHFSEKGKFQRLAYFAADSSKVTFHKGNPRGFRKAPKKTIDMSDPPMTEEQRQGKSSVGYYDEEKNWVPEDSVRNGLSQSGKRVGYFNEAGIFISLDSLHKLGAQSTYDSTTPVMKEGDRTKTWLVNKDGSRIQVDRQWLMDSVKQAKIDANSKEKRRIMKPR